MTIVMRSYFLKYILGTRGLFFYTFKPYEKHGLFYPRYFEKGPLEPGYLKYGHLTKTFGVNYPIPLTIIM